MGHARRVRRLLCFPLRHPGGTQPPLPRARSLASSTSVSSGHRGGNCMADWEVAVIGFCPCAPTPRENCLMGSPHGHLNQPVPQRFDMK